MIQNSSRICVVIVNFNGWDDTRECLDSILQSNCDSVSVVVVDNASSTDLLDQFHRDYPSVHWLRTRENLGWSGGNNIGIDFAFSSGKALSEEIDAIRNGNSHALPADIVLLLNNDTIVHPKLFFHVREAIAIGYNLVGPVINEYFDRNIVQTEGVIFNRRGDPGFFSSVQVPVSDDQTPSCIDVDIINGCAVAFTREVYESLGRIDNRFFLICEESDYCLRAKEAGFRCGVIGRSLVFHKHSVAFKKAGKPIQRYYASRNLWLLLKKHKVGKGRKSRCESIVGYFRHMYHLICFELEHSNPKGAEAIVHGVSDALIGQYGKMRVRDTIVRRCALRIIETIWKLRGGRPLVVSEVND